MVQAVRAKSAARARIAESTAPRLHHVQIAIPPSREDEARRFYGELLGLRELPKPKNLAGRGGVWFKLGEHELHLGVQEDFAPALKAHPAVMLGDLLSVRARLDAAGATTSEDEPLPGYDRCYVNDPFGNRVELLQPKS
ncbi:MAG: glyoxalase [Chloroflexota bacterium]